MIAGRRERDGVTGEALVRGISEDFEGRVKERVLTKEMDLLHVESHQVLLVHTCTRRQYMIHTVRSSGELTHDLGAESYRETSSVLLRSCQPARKTHLQDGRLACSLASHDARRMQPSKRRLP
jgi:hypothetical protein